MKVKVDLGARYKDMLSYQKSIHPFVPTMRELMPIFGVQSTSAVSYILSKLLDAGLLVIREKGNYTQYYAKKPTN